MRVAIEHPTNDAITDMQLQWFGLPGVSGMMLECGGLQFTGAPFAGWYQGTEVASRDFLDEQRYNLLQPLGEAMGMDMSSNTTLWKDEVALELNKAVLHSYKKVGISIIDHFTQADQFIDHLREETKVRGGCPADWVWIVPPQSGQCQPQPIRDQYCSHVTQFDQSYFRIPVLHLPPRDAQLSPVTISGVSRQVV